MDGAGRTAENLETRQATITQATSGEGGAESRDDYALARRAEMAVARRGTRYAEAYQRLHPEAQAAVLGVAGGWAIYIKPGSPVNSARGLGFSDELRPADFEELEDFYRARGVSARLHICPLAGGGLLEQVRARGYVLSGFMSVLTCLIPGDFRAPPPPPGMTARPAGPAEAEAWLAASARGFDGETPAPETFDVLGPNFYAQDAVAFGLWIDEGGGARLAGTGGLYYDPAARALELGGASTLAAYRRRGVQRALIAARLEEGLRRGCDLAVVLTSPGSESQRNLAQAGFRLAYTKAIVEKTW